ncbi:MAG: RNA-guided pseudouridylation complex pseudouridine synthase subunit Cbf5 [Planctomycetota bacterium]|jgi:H/ACA ribonucleoprotein complex subunit 4
MDETKARRWAAPGGKPVAAADPPVPTERALPEHLDFGIVTIDKAGGPTSHDVVTDVKRILGATKAGHGGTLDPNATGVLPVFLGRATRLSRLSLKGGKDYEALARFHADVTRPGVEALTRGFLGKIDQLPPVRSRVKRRLRTRNIDELRVVSVDGRDALLFVSCEAGTYIRKLIHDMGQALGTGAHMVRLRRTRAGPFGLAAAVDVDGLAEAASRARDGEEEVLRRWVVPGEVLAQILPRFVLDPGAAEAVASGTQLAAVGLLRFELPVRAGDEVALLDERGSWIALGEAIVDGEEIAAGAGGLVARPRRVLVRPGEDAPGR